VTKQEELDLEDGTNPEYVLLHAPNTIKESELGIDTLEMIRKTINEWIKEQQ
jgi:hypothetical protein